MFVCVGEGWSGGGRRGRLDDLRTGSFREAFTHGTHWNKRIEPNLGYFL